MRNTRRLAVVTFWGFVACGGGGTDGGSAAPSEVTDAGETRTDAGAETDAGSADASAGDAGAIAPVFAQCGNGVCEPQETQACADCAATTGTCGNGTCDFGESSASCAADCRPVRVTAAPVLALPDLGTGRWKNYVGGLYPGGANTMPIDHREAGIAAARQITPLGLDGQPSATGKVVMISIGMSNTTQEFCAMDGIEVTQADRCRPWTFSGRARDDASVNRATLAVVNGARGGMSIENWTSPPVAHAVPANAACAAGGFATPGNPALYPATAEGNAEKIGVFGANLSFDEEYDRINACNLKANGLGFRQVQVAWVKLSRADAGASMLPDANADAYNLKRDLGNVVRTLKARYPNLRQVYLSSRAYGGFTGSTIAEPYAFETGFAVKWLVEAQINQMRNGGQSVERADAPGYSGDLDHARGVAPWLAWGPYLWANGNQPTSGGAAWFGDVASDAYAGTLASESSASFTQTLTLPPANGGSYYLACGGATRAVPPGPQDAATLHRYCDSDFFTVLANGARANGGGPATFGWASDTQQGVVQEDGTHLTHDGEAKVGTMLLHFFKSAPTAACWFLSGRSC